MNSVRLFVATLYTHAIYLLHAGARAVNAVGGHMCWTRLSTVSQIIFGARESTRLSQLLLDSGLRDSSYYCIPNYSGSTLMWSAPRPL